MRERPLVRVLALAIVVTAAFAFVPETAAACHPPLDVGDDESAHVYFDMGCSHVPPWFLCITVNGSEVSCGPVPPPLYG